MFTRVLPWSSLGMHAKFQAAMFHAFGVMEETHARTRTLTHTHIY